MPAKRLVPQGSIVSLALLILMATPLAWAAEPGIPTNRILVQARPGLPASEVQRAADQHRGQLEGAIEPLNLKVIELPSADAALRAARAISADPRFEFAEVDTLLPPREITPNDPYFSRAWHLPLIGGPEAWGTSLGTGIVVAILDTGVDQSHPDLIGQTVPGWNIYDDNSDTSDVYGHGTKVAGVVAAASNNGLGVASIAWNASIMPVRISRPDGWALISDIAEGLVFAADNGVDVANISYAVSGSSSVTSAAEYMQSLNGVVVVSAGNSGSYDSTPPNPAMISVSATTQSDTLASWSTYGGFVDLSAPGVGIWTTANGGGFSAPSGTSFSSPATAAVVALMMAANPTLGPSEIEGLLLGTARDLGTQGYDIYYGHGRIDAASAVLAAAFDGDPVPDDQNPTVSIVQPTPGEVSGLVPVAVSASDNVSVSGVDLYLNGQFLADDFSPPYQFAWDSTAFPNGPFTLVAIAYDSAGNDGISQPVEVTVNNPEASTDTTPPVVQIYEPADQSTLQGRIAVQVSSTDDQGVAHLALFVDGVLTAEAWDGALYFSWNTRKTSSGWHALSARAEDAAGNAASTQINVYVSQGSGGSGSKGGKGKKP